MDYSDRALAIMSNTTRSGNTPHNVAEVVRKQGVVPEWIVPFSEDIRTFDEYHDKSQINSLVTEMAGDWTTKYTFKHEWVGNLPFLMMEALKYSPLGVAVNAWSKSGEYYVKRGPANHWCIVYGYKENEYWKVFDHYDDTHKKLAWDYQFEFVKRYSIEEKKEQSWVERCCDNVISSIKGIWNV